MLYKEQNATSEAHQIELAEQVLSEWSTGTVAGRYAQWARLHGARDRAAPPYTPTGFQMRMLKRIYLWWLELQLESHLGKHDAYLNRLHDANAMTLDDKLRTAKDVLRFPPMDKGERWAEHQKLVGRQQNLP